MKHRTLLARAASTAGAAPLALEPQARASRERDLRNWEEVEALTPTPGGRTPLPLFRRLSSAHGAPAHDAL